LSDTHDTEQRSKPIRAQYRVCLETTLSLGRAASRRIADLRSGQMVRRSWRRLGPLRGFIYGFLGLTIVVGYGLEPFAAPCEDLIDGPCEHNWASDAQWTVLPLLLLALIGSACLAVWDLGRLVRRRWRRFRD
jgi:hypothetical protein